jgi:ABC-type multidrug transport system ATPase subunit
LSYVPDEAPAYPFMTGREFLDFVTAAKNADADPVVDDLIEAFALPPHLDQRFDAISLGTQKKLLLAAGWIGRPQVLLLDEPSNALDNAARAALIARIEQDRGHAAILFASHDSDFVAATNAQTMRLEALVGDRTEDRATANGLH